MRELVVVVVVIYGVAGGGFGIENIGVKMVTV